MNNFKTISEYDILQYAAIGMTHKIADLELASRENPADGWVYDEIIEGCDKKLEEILNRMDALEKSEEKA